MVTLLLSFCLAALEAGLPSYGTTTGAPRDVGTLANLVKGRALLYLVHNEMTNDQVERILGQPDFGIARSGAGSERWGYRLLGVNVEFGTEGKVVRATYPIYRWRRPP